MATSGVKRMRGEDGGVASASTAAADAAKRTRGGDDGAAAAAAVAAPPPPAADAAARHAFVVRLETMHAAALQKWALSNMCGGGGKEPKHGMTQLCLRLVAGRRFSGVKLVANDAATLAFVKSRFQCAVEAGTAADLRGMRWLVRSCNLVAALSFVVKGSVQRLTIEQRHAAPDELLLTATSPDGRLVMRASCPLLDASDVKEDMAASLEDMQDSLACRVRVTPRLVADVVGAALRAQAEWLRVAVAHASDPHDDRVLHTRMTLSFAGASMNSAADIYMALRAPPLPPDGVDTTTTGTVAAADAAAAAAATAAAAAAVEDDDAEAEVVAAAVDGTPYDAAYNARLVFGKPVFAEYDATLLHAFLSSLASDQTVFVHVSDTAASGTMPVAVVSEFDARGSELKAFFAPRAATDDDDAAALPPPPR